MFLLQGVYRRRAVFVVQGVVLVGLVFVWFTLATVHMGFCWYWTCYNDIAMEIDEILWNKFQNQLHSMFGYICLYNHHLKHLHIWLTHWFSPHNKKCNNHCNIVESLMSPLLGPCWRIQLISWPGLHKTKCSVTRICNEFNNNNNNHINNKDFILRGHSFDNTSIFHEGLKQ